MSKRIKEMVIRYQHILHQYKTVSAFEVTPGVAHYKLVLNEEYSKARVALEQEFLDQGFDKWLGKKLKFKNNEKE